MGSRLRDGEEAYSIAISIQEYLGDKANREENTNICN